MMVRFTWVVEAPQGSRAKFKYDTKLGCFCAGRALSLGLSYPYDWGFVPNTLSEDGDPLDALLIADFASYPGVVVKFDPIGMIQVTQPGRAELAGKRVQNARVILVPMNSPRDRSIWSREVSARVRAELEVFFLTAVALDKAGVEVVGWQTAQAACELIEKSLSH